MATGPMTATISRRHWRSNLQWPGAMEQLPKTCSQCGIRAMSLCASMRDEELYRLNQIGRRRDVAHGQVVAWEGDRSTVCANLVTGVLKLTSSMPDGREAIVGLLFPGDFVGQLFVDETTVTITALSDANLCYYPRDAFEALLDDHPRMERALLNRTMIALDEARARMLALGRQTAEEKIAGFLWQMAQKIGRQDVDGAINFDLPLARGEIADLLGLTIETVSRQMTALRQAGIIDLPNSRGVVVRQPRALAARVAEMIDNAA